MPRPRRTEPARQFKVFLPESVFLRLQTAIADGAMGRRQRLGDYSALVTILITQWLQSLGEPLTSQHENESETPINTEDL